MKDILCLKKNEFGGSFKRVKTCPNGPKAIFVPMKTYSQHGVVLVLIYGAKCGAIKFVKYISDTLYISPSPSPPLSTPSISIHISAQNRRIMSLFRLAREGNTAELRRRLQEEDDVNNKDTRGFTALHGACCRGVSHDILDLVLSYSPRLDERGLWGCTALYVACESNRLGAVQRLVTAGANLEVRGGGGQTPLHVAARYASSDVVDVMLQAGADVHAVDDDGRTPLHHACYTTNLPAVQTLLSHGADVNIRSGYGWTPLLLMLMISRKPASSILPVVQLLCDHGADVNTRDTEGWTPLLSVLMRDASRYFSESSIFPVVQLLRNHGANPYLCVEAGRNAVAVAERRGWMEVLSVLKQCKFIYECHG